MQITANIDEHEYGQIARRVSENLNVDLRFIRETAIRGKFAGRTTYSVRLGVVDMDGDSEVRPVRYSEACDCEDVGMMSRYVVALRDAVLRAEVSAS